MTDIEFDNMTKMEQWVVLKALRAANLEHPASEDAASQFSLRIWGQEVDFANFVSALAKELTEAHDQAIVRDREQFAREHRVLTEGFARMRDLMSEINRQMDEAESGVDPLPAVIQADSLMFVLSVAGERTSYTTFKEAYAEYEKKKGGRKSAMLYVQQTIPGAPVIESLLVGWS